MRASAVLKACVRSFASDFDGFGSLISLGSRA
jgi:hypothetical protein